MSGNDGVGMVVCMYACMYVCMYVCIYVLISSKTYSSIGILCDLTKPNNTEKRKEKTREIKGKISF